jgi:hypothetical protein
MDDGVIDKQEAKAIKKADARQQVRPRNALRFSLPSSRS